MSQKPVSAIIVGGGHRSFTYAETAEKHPELLKIVGIADPDPERRKKALEKFGFPKENCFADAAELARREKFADAIINGTMDHQHVATAVPLLERGYDMLLEKPFAVNEDEMQLLLDTVKKHKNKVMVCHVLRYSEFYEAIKQRLLNGEIGNIVSIQTFEHVSYHHIATSYVRGKWSNSDICHTSMLLAKCCHDLDIMMWMMSDTEPESVSSFGSTFQFKKENAPEGAGTRCLVDCPLVDSCLYSAKRLYLDHPERWSFYVWDCIKDREHATLEEKAELLRNHSPYGRCVYKCDNNVVDHQTVLINFKSGATGTHNMVGGAAVPLRRIQIVGTKGEIFGNFEDNSFTVLKINPAPGTECDREEVSLNGSEGGGHGGGDEMLVNDFLRFQRGETPSIACTSLENSVPGHKVVFLADRSRLNSGAAQKY